MKRMLICAALLLQGCQYSATWEVEQHSPAPNPRAGTFKVSYSYWGTRLFGEPIQDNWDEYWVASKQCSDWGYKVTQGAIDDFRVPNATRVGPIRKECGYNPAGSSPPGLKRSCVIWYVSSHWMCVKS